MTAPLLVTLGAMVGAPLRYLADRAVSARHDSLFPWGTWVVNVAGSALLGVLVAGALAGVLPRWAGTLGGVGFCGALTTYSTFGYETVRLAEDGAVGYALLNVAASVAAGLLAALAGFGLGRLLW